MIFTHPYFSSSMLLLLVSPTFQFALQSPPPSFPSSSLAGLPSSPAEMCSRATASCVRAIEAGEMRLSVSFVVPLLPTVRPEDIDPWPGGLKQQFDTVKEMTTSILAQLVTGRGDEPGQCRQQVISSEDACAFIIQEAQGRSEGDVAALIFPSPDQLQDIKQVEEMVGGRPLLVINPQYRRPSDFGFFKRREGEELLGRFTQGYAFEEFSCRGESVKLTFDRREGWRSFCVVGDDPMNQRAEGVFSLHAEPLLQRPSYSYLEACINSELPDPAWRRAMK